MRQRLVVSAAFTVLLLGCSAAASPSPSPSPTPSPAPAWQRVQNLPQSTGGAALQVVATTSGFAAVGSGGLRGPGTVWTSTDGTTWQATPGETSLSTMLLTAVAPTPTGLAAFGANCPATGECIAVNVVTFDGSTWSQPGLLTLPAGIISGAPARFATIGGQIVGVGSMIVTDDPFTQAAVVWTSPTGSDWTQVPDSPIFAKAQMYDVAVGAHGLVAVGSADTTSQIGTDAAVWTSPDGLTWTRVPSDPSFVDAAMNGISATASGFVAVGQGPLGAAVWTSADGTAWVRVADQPAFQNATMYGVASDGSGLVAAGYGHDSAAILTSPDGTTWTRVPDGPAFAMAQAVSVAANGGRVVVAGRANGETSPQAIIWSKH